MIDVVAFRELLIDFATKSTDENGYLTMAANPGGGPGTFPAALNDRSFSFSRKPGADTQLRREEADTSQIDEAAESAPPQAAGFHAPAGSSGSGKHRNMSSD